MQAKITYYTPFITDLSAVASLTITFAKDSGGGAGSGGTISGIGYTSEDGVFIGPGDGDVYASIVDGEFEGQGIGPNLLAAIRPVVDLTGTETEVGVCRFSNESAETVEIPMYEKIVTIDNLTLDLQNPQTILIPYTEDIDFSRYISVTQISATADDRLFTGVFGVSVNKAEEGLEVEIRALREIADVSTFRLTFTLRFVKTDDSLYDLCDLYIPVSNSDASGIEVNVSDRKHNKGSLISFTIDDAPALAYSSMLALVNNKPVPNITDAVGSGKGSYYHANQAKAADYPANATRRRAPLAVTDGCGNDRRFRFGVGIMPHAGVGTDGTGTAKMDYTVGVGAGDRFKMSYLLGIDMPSLLDFDCSLYQHDVNAQKWDCGPANGWSSLTAKQQQAYADNVLQGLAEDRTKIINLLGEKITIMAEPNGQKAYMLAASQDDNFVMATNQSGGQEFTHAQLLTTDLHKKETLRRIYDDPTAILPWLQANYQLPADQRKWLHFFAHNSSGENWIKAFGDIFDFFGKEGNDDTWFATMDEVYAYYYLRRHTIIRKSLKNGKLHIRLLIPKMNDTRHREITLNVTGVTVTGTLAASDKIVGLTAAQKSDYYQVNLNLEPSLLTRAVKYTEILETKRTPDAKDDALYFVNQLRASATKSNLQDRITAVALQN